MRIFRAIRAAVFPFHPALQPIKAFYSKNSQTSVLTRLGQSEQDRPKYTFSSSTYWQQHLSKREYIKRYAAQQDYDTSPERQRLKPPFYFLPGMYNSIFHISKRLEHSMQ